MKKQDASNCTLCGLCKSVCPIFQITKSETDSPRGKAILLKNKIKDLTFFRCTLCGRCELVCPSGINFNFKSVRSELVGLGKAPSPNKEMIENVRKHGTPFGKADNEKKPKNLYCC